MANASTQTARQVDISAAVRHVVYLRLLNRLPIATVDQVNRFICNLALSRPFQDIEPDKYSRRMWDLEQRFVNLRVAPELNQAPCQPWKLIDIERMLVDQYGDKLAHVAGFYRGEFRWKLNLPAGCAFHGYTNRNGFYTGILCQPLASIDSYFLLSASKLGGSKAIRMEPRDAMFFDRYKEPAQRKHLNG